LAGLAECETDGLIEVADVGSTSVRFRATALVAGARPYEAVAGELAPLVLGRAESETDGAAVEAGAEDVGVAVTEALAATAKTGTVTDALGYCTDWLPNPAAG
jgi:hypothetical protein